MIDLGYARIPLHVYPLESIKNMAKIDQNPGFSKNKLMWTKWNCSYIGIYTPFSKMFPQVIGWRCMTWHVFERKEKYLVIYVAEYVAWFTSQDSQVIVLAFYPQSDREQKQYLHWLKPSILALRLWEVFFGWFLCFHTVFHCWQVKWACLKISSANGQSTQPKSSDNEKILPKQNSCFRSKGSKSFSIGDHYSIMGYGSLLANRLTHIPVSN